MESGASLQESPSGRSEPCVAGIRENPLANPTFEQYLRLAGFVSLVSFMVNSGPTLFGRVIGHITP